MRTETITSANNPKVRLLLQLQEKSRLRQELGQFVLEGRREILHCIESGYEASTLFLCRDIFPEWESARFLSAVEKSSPDCHVMLVSSAVYDRIAYRKGTEGVIAEMKCRDLHLQDIRLKDNPLVVVLESVEKPGNLGAILRSADASGADAVIVCDPLTDIYNPNILRASIGSAFTVQFAAASSEECLKWLKANNIRIYTAQLQDSEWYYDTDMRCGTALVMGTEADGLSDFWREAADAHIKIPMLGKMDSLNVSVSTAVLLYEAVRQRNSKS